MQEQDRRNFVPFTQTTFSASLRALVLGTAALFGDAPAQEPKEPPVATKADPKIAALIEQMGNRDFATRERVSKELQKLVLGDDSEVLAQVKRALKHPDPEIASRARTLVDAYYNVGPTSWPAVPWIDQLPEGYPNRQKIIDKYLALARNGGEWSVINEPGWPEWRTATSYYVHDLLSSGKPRAEVVKLLDAMAEIEKGFCVKQGIVVR